jgi:hypothetical protein
MITSTTYLQLHMSCITEIQEAVVVVIIWWCDLQLHLKYITEIQEANTLSTTATDAVQINVDFSELPCSFDRCKLHVFVQ